VPQRRQGLEQREHRPAQQACLLAGDDGDGLGIEQALCGLARGRWGFPPGLLPEESLDDDCTVARVRPRPRDGVPPGVRRGGVPGVERGEPLRRCRVVGCEPAGPRQQADVDRPRHRGR
jgi:hypothetical protein